MIAFIALPPLYLYTYFQISSLLRCVFDYFVVKLRLLTITKERSPQVRMWMVNPKLLCRKHLLGEHGELHKFHHNFVKGHSIKGRIGQIEPSSMQSRHDELAAEMLSRGMKHKSPYSQPDLSKYDLTGFVVDTEVSLNDLCERCPECKKNIDNPKIA